MAILRWAHDKSAAEVANILKTELEEKGHATHVKWHGHKFSASVGFGAILKINGDILDHEFVIEQSSGALGGTTLTQIREILERHFPGGEIT